MNQIEKIIKELNNLPTYFYSFSKEDKMCFALLGGHGEPTITKINTLDTLLYLHNQMLCIYENDILTEENKIQLAKYPRKINNACGGRFEDYKTLKQQEIYLRTLSKEALDEISNQIKMYKDAREYYRQYIFKG